MWGPNTEAGSLRSLSGVPARSHDSESHPRSTWCRESGHKAVQGPGHLLSSRPLPRPLPLRGPGPLPSSRSSGSRPPPEVTAPSRGPGWLPCSHHAAQAHPRPPAVSLFPKESGFCYFKQYSARGASLVVQGAKLALSSREAPGSDPVRGLDPTRCNQRPAGSPLRQRSLKQHTL